jgi:hypothetical protein
MQLWQCAANANMASCRKCNHGIVPQMQLGQRAANATNGQDRTRVSILPITGKPCGLRRRRGAGDGEGVARPTATARGWRGLRRRRGVGAAYGDGEGLARPTATARGWRGLRRRRGAGAAYGDGEGLAPCFQIAGTQAAPKKTQQNSKNTYCERNNLSQSRRCT